MPDSNHTLFTAPALRESVTAIGGTGVPFFDVPITDVYPGAGNAPGTDIAASYNNITGTMWIRPGLSSAERCASAVHEYAHAVFQRAQHTDVSLRPHIDAVLKRIAASPEYRLALDHLYFGMPEDQAIARYLIDPDEEWARAFAQYAFTHYGTTERQHALWRASEPDPNVYRTMQWTDESFAPIMAEFDREFPVLATSRRDVA